MDETVIPLPKMARQLGVSVAWLRDMANEGKVPCIRAGKRFLFSASAVQKALLTLASQPTMGGRNAG
jgi:excisionase family DNA binding protein